MWKSKGAVEDVEFLLDTTSINGDDAFEDSEPHSGLRKEYYLQQPSKVRRLSSSISSFLQYLLRTKRTSRRRTWKVLCCSVLVAFSIICLTITWSVTEAILFPSYAHPPEHYRVLRDQITSSSSPGRGNPSNEKVFIATNILNADLIRGFWGENVLSLIDYLGPDNVFLSVYENDAGPETAAALRDLENALPCMPRPILLVRIQSDMISGNSSVVTGAHLSLDDFPTVTVPNGEERVQRITYLAEVRNKLMRPLYAPTNESLNDGVTHVNRTFDRVFFLNDVLFDPIEAAQLVMATNLDPVTNRTDYDVACSIDFVAKFMFYDTFVVRDNEGFGMGLMFYPWFTSKGKGESRSDVVAEKDAVRVKSCWGGMASYDARFFQHSSALARPADGEHPSSYPTTSKEMESVAEMSGDLAIRSQYNPQPYSLNPLRFRSDSEIYWEASECCLINADVAARVMAEDATATPKIFINPYIRVAYDMRTYGNLKKIQRYERVFRILQYVVSKIGYPEYNPRREETPGALSLQNRWMYHGLPATEGYHDAAETKEWLTQMREAGEEVGTWWTVGRFAEPGGFCGQRRLFLMKQDLGKANSIFGGKNWEKGVFP